MIKKLIKFLLYKLGYRISKYNPNLDDSLKFLFKEKKNLVIFDIGANTGQSIERFNNLFNDPLVYSFEPNKKSYDILKNKYKDKKNYIFNFAFGDQIENKKFNINLWDQTSSFYEINNKYHTLRGNKTLIKENVPVDTLDNFTKNKQINNIDILKIDTQMYEEKILLGGSEILNNIKCIELEIFLENYYNKKSSFYNIEKILNKYNFKLFNISDPSYDKQKRIQWLDAVYFKEK